MIFKLPHQNQSWPVVYGPYSQEHSKLPKPGPDIPNSLNDLCAIYMTEAMPVFALVLKLLRGVYLQITSSWKKQLELSVKFQCNYASSCTGYCIIPGDLSPNHTEFKYAGNKPLGPRFSGSLIQSDKDELN